MTLKAFNSNTQKFSLSIHDKKVSMFYAFIYSLFQKRFLDYSERDAQLKLFQEKMITNQAYCKELNEKQIINLLQLANKNDYIDTKKEVEQSCYEVFIPLFEKLIHSLSQDDRLEIWTKLTKGSDRFARENTKKMFDSFNCIYSNDDFTNNDTLMGSQLNKIINHLLLNCDIPHLVKMFITEFNLSAIELLQKKGFNFSNPNFHYYLTAIDEIFKNDGEILSSDQKDVLIHLKNEVIGSEKKHLENLFSTEPTLTNKKVKI